MVVWLVLFFLGKPRCLDFSGCEGAACMIISEEGLLASHNCGKKEVSVTFRSDGMYVITAYVHKNSGKLSQENKK